MRRLIAMVFGLCFASLWLGCGVDDDELWADDGTGVKMEPEDFGIEEPVPQIDGEPDLDIPAPASHAAGEAE